MGALGLTQMLSYSTIRGAGRSPARICAIRHRRRHLIHFRDHGNIFIKLGSATGSETLALGTQQVMVGSGIPIYRHFKMNEAFYVLQGGGTFILNDVRQAFEKGGTIFIPRTPGMGLRIPITNYSNSGL